MGDGEWELFIAYPSPERPAADELYEELEARGASVFLDHRSLVAGDAWPARIAAAQDAARVTVVLVSNESKAAYYTGEEIQRGLSLMQKDPARHRVVPVFLDDDVDAPYGLHQLRRLSRTDRGGMGGVAGELLAIAQRLARRPPSTPSVDPDPEKRRTDIVRAMFHGRPRRWLLLTALPLAVAGGGLAAAIRGNDQPTVGATIKIGEVTKGNEDGPNGVGVAGKDVVVLTYDGLVRIDPDRNALAGELYDLGPPGQGVAVGGGGVWVTTLTPEGTVRVLKFTLIGGAVASKRELLKAHAPDELAQTRVSIDAHDAWVIDGTHTVRAFDRATNAISHIAVLRAATGTGAKVLPRAVFAGERAVWVAAESDGRALVYRIKRSAGRTAAAAPTGYRGAPGDLALVETKGSVWVVNSSANAVTRLDAETGRPIGRPTPVGSSPQAIAAGFGELWVANTASGTVNRINPASGKAIGASIRVGSQPTAIAVGANAVWVTSKGATADQSHNVIRINP